jgi:hypothetical protein
MNKTLIITVVAFSLTGIIVTSLFNWLDNNPYTQEKQIISKVEVSYPAMP